MKKMNAEEGLSQQDLVEWSDAFYEFGRMRGVDGVLVAEIPNGYDNKGNRLYTRLVIPVKQPDV